MQSILHRCERAPVILQHLRGHVEFVRDLPFVLVHAFEQCELGRIDEREDGTDTADSAYTPVFSKQVRTVVYVLGLIASCVGLGFMTFGDAAVGGYISTVAGFIASGLGVAYNPLRNA